MKYVPVFLMLGLLVLPGAVGGQAGSFEAVIMLGSASSPAQGRLYVVDGDYRLETISNQVPVQLMVNTATGKTHILDPRQKRYTTIPSRNSQSLRMNPIEAFRLTAGFYRQQKTDRESIQGLVCEKTVYLSNGSPLMTAWVSRRLGFPVKLVNHRFPEMCFELRNIQETAVSVARMTPPTDFIEVSAEPVPSPDGDNPAANEPSEWMVTAGERKRVDLPEGKGFTINVADDSADGLQSKGKIVFHRRAAPPLDRFESSFRMPNGRSQDVAYPASALIRAIEFQVIQGAIVLRLDTPP